MLEGLHHHQSVLFSNIGQLLEKKRFLDVMLTCHNEAIMVHKLVLVAYSRYFDAVLLGHADRCPVINIDSTGIEFETLRAVISFMYKGIADMTHCGIEKFASALKTLEIDTNIQLVSAEDELTERQNLGSSGVHVITEGSMTEDDYFSGKHDLVANEVILPEVHLSQPEQMPQDLQHLQASVISQCDVKDVLCNEQLGVMGATSLEECIKNKQFSPLDELRTVDYILSVAQPVRRETFTHSNDNTAQDIVTRDEVTESRKSPQSRSELKHTNNVTVKVIYSNTEMASESQVAAAVGDVRLAKVCEPLSTEKAPSPDYQAVSLLLNFKEQDRNIVLEPAGSLTKALPKIQAPVLPVALPEDAAGRISEEECPRTEQNCAVLLSGSDHKINQDLLGVNNAVSDREQYNLFPAEIGCTEEPVSGPEVEISSLGDVYSSSLSVVGEMKSVCSDAERNHDDNKNYDVDIGDDKNQNRWDWKHRLLIDNAKEDSNDGVPQVEEDCVETTRLSSNKRTPRQCEDGSRIKKLPSSKRNRSRLKRAYQRCSPIENRKQQLLTIKFPKLMPQNCKRKEREEILSSEKMRLELDFDGKNELHSSLLLEDLDCFNNERPSIHDEEKRDMWLVKDGFYTCKICHWRKRQPTTLLRHLMFHTGEKPFICDYCSKGFNTRHRLKEHTRTHTGEMPYHCTLCNKSFASVRSLRVHINNHTRSKTYTCHYCGKVTTDKGNLKKHVRCVHKKHKHITCTVPDCKFKASDYSMALLHIDKDHSEELPVDSLAYYMWLIQIRQQFYKKEKLTCYKCNFIGKNFKRLYSHMRNAHQLQQDQLSSSVLTNSLIVPTHLQCQYCTYLCLTKEKMANHLSRIHGVTHRGLDGTVLTCTNSSQTNSTYSDAVNSQVEKILQTYRPLAPSPSCSSVESKLQNADMKLGIRSPARRLWVDQRGVLQENNTVRPHLEMIKGHLHRESNQSMLDDVGLHNESLFGHSPLLPSDPNDITDHQFQKILDTYRQLVPNPSYNMDEKQMENEKLPSSVVSPITEHVNDDITPVVEKIIDLQSVNKVSNPENVLNSSTHDNIKDLPLQAGVSTDGAILLPKTEIATHVDTETVTVCDRHEPRNVIPVSPSYENKEIHVSMEGNADKQNVIIKIVPSSRTLSASQTWKPSITKIQQLDTVKDPPSDASSHSYVDIKVGNEVKCQSDSQSYFTSDDKKAVTLAVIFKDGTRPVSTSSLTVDSDAEFISTANKTDDTVRKLQPNIYDMLKKKKPLQKTKIRGIKKHSSYHDESQIGLLLPVHCSVKYPGSSHIKLSAHDENLKEHKYTTKLHNVITISTEEKPTNYTSEEKLYAAALDNIRSSTDSDPLLEGFDPLSSKPNGTVIKLMPVIGESQPPVFVQQQFHKMNEPTSVKVKPYGGKVIKMALSPVVSRTCATGSFAVVDK